MRTTFDGTFAAGPTGYPVALDERSIDALIDLAFSEADFASNSFSDAMSQAKTAIDTAMGRTAIGVMGNAGTGIPGIQARPDIMGTMGFTGPRHAGFQPTQENNVKTAPPDIRDALRGYIGQIARGMPTETESKFGVSFASHFHNPSISKDPNEGRGFMLGSIGAPGFSHDYQLTSGLAAMGLPGYAPSINASAYTADQLMASDMPLGVMSPALSTFDPQAPLGIMVASNDDVFGMGAANIDAPAGLGLGAPARNPARADLPSLAATDSLPAMLDNAPSMAAPGATSGFFAGMMDNAITGDLGLSPFDGAYGLSDLVSAEPGLRSGFGAMPGTMSNPRATPSEVFAGKYPDFSASPLALDQVSLTSDFGPRNAGVPGASSFHPGLDFAGPVGGMTGVGVQSMTGGEVTKVGARGGLGNAVTVRDPEGFETTYGHLASIAPGLKVGAMVDPGTPLGVMGNTGLPGMGIHLDVRTREPKTGQFIDTRPAFRSVFEDPMPNSAAFDARTNRVTMNVGQLPEVVQPSMFDLASIDMLSPSEVSYNQSAPGLVSTPSVAETAPPDPSSVSLGGAVSSPQVGIAGSVPGVSGALGLDTAPSVNATGTTAGLGVASGVSGSIPGFSVETAATPASVADLAASLGGLPSNVGAAALDVTGLPTDSPISTSAPIGPVSLDSFGLPSLGSPIGVQATAAPSVGIGAPAAGTVAMNTAPQVNTVRTVSIAPPASSPAIPAPEPVAVTAPAAPSVATTAAPTTTVQAEEDDSFLDNLGLSPAGIAGGLIGGMALGPIGALAGNYLGNRLVGGWPGFSLGLGGLGGFGSGGWNGALGGPGGVGGADFGNAASLGRGRVGADPDMAGYGDSGRI